MQVVYFYNFSNEDFTGQWNSEATLIKAGQKEAMEDWKAQHFAKHLANREVIKLPGGETHTSPKFPDQDPMFYDLFNKAIIPIASIQDVLPEHIELEVAKEKLSKKKKTTKVTDEAEFAGLKD